MIPQFMKDKTYPAFYKLFAVGILALSLMPEIAALACAVILFLLFLIIYRRDHSRVSLDTNGRFLTAYCFLILISIFWAKLQANTAFTFIMWLCAFAVYVIILNLCDTKEKVENIMLCTVGSAGACSVVAILQMFFMAIGKAGIVPSPLYARFDSFFSRITDYPVFIEAAQDRVSGTFGTPLALSTFLIIAFPLAVFLCFYGKTVKRKRFAIAVSFLIFFGIMFTFLKGTVVAVILSLMTLSFAGKKPAKFMSAIAGVSSVTMLLVIYLRRGITAAQDISTANRVTLWRTCLQIFKEHPFGVGAGSDNLREYLFAEKLYFVSAHNLFVELLTETGIVSFVLFIAMAVISVRNIFNLYDCGGWYKRYSTAFSASLIAFSAMSLFEHTLYYPTEVIYFAVLLALIDATKHIAIKKGRLKEKGREEKDEREA